MQRAAVFGLVIFNFYNFNGVRYNTLMSDKDLEKRWKAYHKFGVASKRRYLKALSPQKGFATLTMLSDFAAGLKAKYPPSRNYSIDKLNVLIRVHKIFGKVKP